MERAPAVETGVSRYLAQRLRGSSTISVIYSPHEFREIIDRECEWADRYHGRFSLAVFEVDTRDENSALIRSVVRTIHHRFRNTDELGWYRRGQVGVIMPFTPSEGAWKLAEDVSNVISSFTSPPPFTIYSYPSENWPKRHHLGGFAGFLNIVALLRRLLTPPTPRSAEFHALIARERGRADRNGNVFSLVIFRMANLPPGISVQRRMLMTLRSRLRDTDELGWYDDQLLGAILPYASRQDAQRIAENICTSMSIPASTEIFRVYTYPDSWFSGQRLAAALDSTPAIPAESPAAPMEEPPPVNRWPSETVVKQGTAGHDVFLYRPLPFWKRALDLAGSLTAITLLSPLFLFAAVLIKMVSPGPILFKQERIGYMRRPFMLFKFRTMEVNANAEIHSHYVRKLIVEDSESRPMTKLEHSPSIIRHGRLLRSSCIDELPQLFNVVRGEMSMVGPRPCLAYEADEYLRWHSRRFDTIPGMTGLWQVKGKNRTTFKEMIRLDINYTQNRSLWLDLKILLMTPVAILRQILEKPHPAGIGASRPETSGQAPAS
jgi:lipopolysaccharide/colanic/teichoic acid biosynthesis glycosyltransferase